MPRMIVSAEWVLSDYPGMRPGRIYAGKPDLTRHPRSDTHVVDGPDAGETVCGLPRARFPHEFPEGTSLSRRANACDVCRPAG